MTTHPLHAGRVHHKDLWLVLPGFVVQPSRHAEDDPLTSVAKHRHLTRIAAREG